MAVLHTSDRAACQQLARDELAGLDVLARRLSGRDAEDLVQEALPLDDIAVYPLFTPDVLALMGRLLSDDAKQHIATSVIARARKRAPREQRGGACGTAARPAVRNLDGIDPDIRADGLAGRLTP